MLDIDRYMYRYKNFSYPNEAAFVNDCFASSNAMFAQQNQEQTPISKLKNKNFTNEKTKEIGTNTILNNSDNIGKNKNINKDELNTTPNQNIEKCLDETMSEYLQTSLSSDDLLNSCLVTDFDKAEYYLEEFEKIRKGFDPNIYKKFIAKYIQMRDVDKIEKTREKLKLYAIELDDQIYNSIFYIYTQTGNEIITKKLFDEMRLKQVYVNENFCKNYINLLYNAGKLNEAASVFNFRFYAECFKNPNEINMCNLSPTCAMIALDEFLKQWNKKPFIIITTICPDNPNPYVMRIFMEDVIIKKNLLGYSIPQKNLACLYVFSKQKSLYGYKK